LATEAEFGVTLQENEVDLIETMGDVLALLRARLLVDVESAALEAAK
jgi:acyl carrier protein